MANLIPGDIVLCDTTTMGIHSMGPGAEFLENILLNSQTPLQTTRNDCVVTADGSTIFVALNVTPFIAKIDVVSGTRYANPVSLPPGAVQRITLSPDETEVVLGHSTTPFFTRYRTSDMVKLSDPATPPAGTGYKPAFSPDGTLMAIGHATSPFISIYNTSDMSKVANPGTLPPTTGSGGTDFSPNGQWLAVGCANTSPRLRVYNVADWSSVTLGATIGSVNLLDVKFSPDSTKLACVSSSGAATTTIYVYDTSTWTFITLPSLSGYKLGAARKVEWYGNRVIGVIMDSTPSAALFIDVVSGQVVKYVDIGVSAINGAGVVPGGSFRRLAGTVKDPADNPLARAVRAYDRTTGKLIGETNSLVDGSFDLKVFCGRSSCVVALGTSPENSKLIDRVTPVIIT